ncbi:UV radiation resistance protein and autophagy-related subunit 14-domain-containing protein [Jimgerdemannia flammicorona]|uniref:Autophagy-related protein 14 n=1 Tax=Jimgerdemannia flammicorona TaxID=994334 RepID=A0A433BDX0_9FUNG|nr:UV radiation resistance protein and autophagy-related subunit 14-domain-containing protein [Jimgerdemannia flammicorona]
MEGHVTGGYICHFQKHRTYIEQSKPQHHRTLNIMVASGKQKNRPILAPQQRRIRHIHSILARNLTWNPPKPLLLDDAITANNNNAMTHADDARSETSGGATTPPFGPSPSTSLTLPTSQQPPHSPTFSPSASATSSSRNSLRASLDKQTLRTFNRLNASHCQPKRTGSTPSLVGLSEDATTQPQLTRTDSSSSLTSMASTSQTLEDSTVVRGKFTVAYASMSRLATSLEEIHPVPKEKKGLMDTYFTLHLKVEEPAFYTSETLSKSINPNFRAIDSSQFASWCNTRGSKVVVRLWARNSAKMENQQMREDRNGAETREEEEETNGGYRLLIEWDLEMCCLRYLGKHLEEITTTIPPNLLIFELVDGYYTTPDFVSRPSNLVESTQTEEDLTLAEGHKAKRSYTYDRIMRLSTLLQVIYDTQRSCDEEMQKIDITLEREKDTFRMNRELSERFQSVLNLQGMLEEQKRELEHDRRRIDRHRETIRNRRLALEEASSRHRQGEEYLDENQQTLTRNRELHARTTASLNTRRKELLADMFSIYPIEQVSSDSLQHQIRGCVLPNSVYTGCDEERIATALGYTCHLVSMLAYYLGLPLRYPMVPRGSRAKVTDPVSVMQGSREFPLYSKGVERYRFEYGVFLLNKNIEQLINAYGLIVLDLRHTLPNLRYLIQTVLTTSVTSTAPSSISLLSISNTSTPANSSSNNRKSQSRPSPLLLPRSAPPRSQLALTMQLKAPPTASSSGSHSTTTTSPAGSLPSGSPSPPLSPLSSSPFVSNQPHLTQPQITNYVPSFMLANGGIAIPYFGRARAVVQQRHQDVVGSAGVGGVGTGGGSESIAQQIYVNREGSVN